MAALPWYLLAAGLVLVVVGFLLAGLSGSSRSRHRGLDPDMDDDEIARHLRDEQRVSFPGLVIVFGFVCVLVSIAWRLARYFL